MDKQSFKDKIKVPLALEEKILITFFIIMWFTSLGMLIYWYMTI